MHPDGPLLYKVWYYHFPKPGGLGKPILVGKVIVGGIEQKLNPKYLYKIVIEINACGSNTTCDKVILQQLEHYGITYSSLFPSIERINDIIMETGF